MSRGRRLLQDVEKTPASVCSKESIVDRCSTGTSTKNLVITIWLWADAAILNIIHIPTTVSATLILAQERHLKAEPVCSLIILWFLIISERNDICAPHRTFVIGDAIIELRISLDDYLSFLRFT